MGVHFNITSFISAGRYAAVFLAKTCGECSAMKFQVVSKEDVESARQIALREFQLHQGLSDIGTVPIPYQIFPEYAERYASMGLPRLGIALEDLLPQSVKDERVRDPYFCSPYRMDFVPCATNLCSYAGKLTKDYFDLVEITMSVAHDRGIILPSDLEGNILISKEGKPFIVDFDFGFWYGELTQEEFYKARTQNIQTLENLRERYQY
jgi:hypothetical protein